MALRAFWPPVKFSLTPADEASFRKHGKELGEEDDASRPPSPSTRSSPSMESGGGGRKSVDFAGLSRFLTLAGSGGEGPSLRTPLLSSRASRLNLNLKATKTRPATFVALFRDIYHKYGLNHLCLLVVLALYSVLGAAMFVWFERPAQDKRLADRNEHLQSRRHGFVERTFDQIFNDTSQFLLFINAKQSKEIQGIMERALVRYERQSRKLRGAQYDEHLLLWDFWNAMLYSWTLITTIGYGHLYPMTEAGKIATMVYAIFGIPLMLLILNDLGKLLTKFMKFPFFLAKKWGRRLFQYCTRMTREQIRLAEKRDKQRLEVFDLPVPVAIGIVVGWIFLCSAIQLMWEDKWDYLVAFYFFFISLSTIGLGDIEPENPRYLLIMFGNIIIGLSLVSMCISLIQMKLESTYKAGENSEKKGEVIVVLDPDSGDDEPIRADPSPKATPTAATPAEPVELGPMLAEHIRKAHSVPVAIAIGTPPPSRRTSFTSSHSAPSYASRQRADEEVPPKRSGKLRKSDRRRASSSEEPLLEAPVGLSSYSVQGTQTLSTPELDSEAVVTELAEWERDRPPPPPPEAPIPKEEEEDEDSPFGDLISYDRHTRPRSPKEWRISAEAAYLKKELSEYENMGQVMRAEELISQIRSEAQLTPPDAARIGRFTRV